MPVTAIDYGYARSRRPGSTRRVEAYRLNEYSSGRSRVSRRGKRKLDRSPVIQKAHQICPSESDVGGRKKLCAAGTAINGSGGGRYRSDEFPRRRCREVPNPHTWPMRAKIAKIRRGEREPAQNSDLGAGHQSAQANTGGRRGTSANPTGPDEESTVIIHGGEAARATAVVFRVRLWQTGQEIGISVGAALAVLEGEKLEPPLESRIVVSHFADAFERLMTRNDAKTSCPRGSLEAV